MYYTNVKEENTIISLENQKHSALVGEYLHHILAVDEAVGYLLSI